MAETGPVAEQETPAPRRRTIPPAAEEYRPNAILRWLYSRFFRHIHVDDHWRGVVKDAAGRGTVVYVMRTLSLLDFLCLDYLIKRLGLPLVRFVNDLGLWILEPFGKGGRRLRLRRQIPEDRALKDVVTDGFSALLFLRRRPRFGRPQRRGADLQGDLIRTLVTAQRAMEEPILLVPQTFVWSHLPPRRRRGFLDFLFGPVEWPGKIRVFFQFLLNFRNAQLRSGDPFDLARFLGEHPDLDDAEAADKIRYALLRRMERERALVLGPTKKSPGRIREELLRSPRVQRAIESQARATGKSVASVEKQAKKELRKLCADQSPHFLGVAKPIFDWIWNRMYDGIVVDKEGIERLRQAAREGAVILLPSHKSHVDYLVLSYVLYTNALSPPLIAAGDNLGFWPLGPILRWGGAFFIRRSFKGRKLYAALVDAYMRKLLVEGFAVEFFIEGGRSRTGKLLPPRLGLLSMIVDAALLLSGKKVQFVPISIGYERIIEQTSYVHELSGGEKQKENIGGLLRTPRVLRSKYGRLYVQVGDILPMDAVRDELTPKERRSLVQRIAHRMVYEINRVTVVTPAALVATALLAHRRRGMPRSTLAATCTTLLDVLERKGARVAGQLVHEGELREDVLREALALFIDARLLVEHDVGGESIYRVPSERRIALEYYKNNILHFFVPSALIGASLLTGSNEPISEHTLRERVLQLSRLFKYEFMYRADALPEAIFEDALKAMLGRDELVRMADHVRVADGPGGAIVPSYAAMIRTYFESYLLAIRGAEALLHEPLTEKEWMRRTLAFGQRMYLAGEIELRESLSKTKLESALASLRDHGLVRYAGEGNLRAAEDVSVSDFRDLESQLKAFLR